MFMKVTILTYGSRGDVQPFIPLSLALMSRGHAVKLVAPARFKDLVEEYGVNFVPLAGDPAELSRRLNDSGYNTIKMVREIMRHAVEIGHDVLLQVEKSCEDADLVIHTFLHAVGAHTVARERNIPDIHVQIFPVFTPTGDYPNVTLPNLRIRSLNRLTHQMARSVSIRISQVGFDQVRHRVGLPERKLYSPFDGDAHRPPTPILCAWSPNVIPPSNDWSANVHVTGYFHDETFNAYLAPDKLQRFLANGKPPICVSFGSMLNKDAEKIDRVIRECLERTGNRGIILSGWNQLSPVVSSNDFLYLDAVPHQWLLPHCKAFIHHGGAGTASAGLRAGIPNIVIPFTADQPFWGNKIHAIGAGPKPIPVKRLSVRKLTGAIQESDEITIRMGANTIGQKLRTEEGAVAAVDLIEKHYQDFLRLKP